MSIKSHIQDGKGSGKTASVVEKVSFPGIVSYTEPLYEYNPALKFFINPENGINLAVDAGAVGTPVNVHNGNDNPYWTGTQITGGGEVNFSSTNRFFDGAQSIYVNRGDQDEVWQFDRGSDLDLSTYGSVTMYINVDNNWAVGDSIVFYGYDTGTGATVGAEVSLGDYFNPQSFDVWQKLSIPLSDMALENETIDSFRMRVDTISGQRPRWYIDVIRIEESGSFLEYKVEPAEGKLILFNKFRFIISDAYTGTVTDGTMPGISYNTLLGLPSLSGGIVITRQKEGVIDFSVSIRNIADFFIGNGNITTAISDGTNTSLVIELVYDEYFILNPLTNDELKITISDDLSGLLQLNANVSGKEIEIDKL